MKILLVLALTAILGLGFNEYKEVQTEKVITEAQEMVEAYDVDKDGVLSENEQYSFVDDIYADYGDGSFEKEEIESAVYEAKFMLGGYDKDQDGDLSHDEQMQLVRDVYKAYDNGEIKNADFRAFLAGYEKKVNELNSYTALLDEVGVPGPSHYIDLRGEN